MHANGMQSIQQVRLPAGDHGTGDSAGGNKPCLNGRGVSEEQAATIIQKHFRGYRARKPFLPTSLYPVYRKLCERAIGDKTGIMPRAEVGKTEVYLPDECPGLVLKESGRTEAIERIRQMMDCRATLESASISNLCIPRARLCGDFVVEERYPVTSNNFLNMGMYVQHTGLFDDAVRGMVKLFEIKYLGDLLGRGLGKNILTRNAGVKNNIRYDNIPIFISEGCDEKVGKIGLIDLEHLVNSPGKEGLIDLARIFPFHLGIIQKEAEHLGMTFNVSQLEAAAVDGVKYLKVGFSDRASSFICTYVAIIHRYISLAVNNNIIESLMS